MPHNIKVPRAFWDTGAEVEADPKYHWEKFQHPILSKHESQQPSERDLRALDAYHFNKVYGTSPRERRKHEDMQRKWRSILMETPKRPLTETQMEAIYQVLDHRVSIIQGPPGTGKTTTSVTLIRSWVQGMRYVPVLASAYSNVAVDQMLAGLVEDGVKCVR